MSKMYWQILQIILFTFVPLPIRPKLTRPDPKKNFWTFECEGFTSCYKVARVFYENTLAAEILSTHAE